MPPRSAGDGAGLGVGGRTPISMTSRLMISAFLTLRMVGAGVTPSSHTCGSIENGHRLKAQRPRGIWNDVVASRCRQVKITEYGGEMSIGAPESGSATVSRSLFTTHSPLGPAHDPSESPC